jgi:hypothetical protein
MVSGLLLCGCGDKSVPDIAVDKSLSEKIDLDKTIGAFGEIFTSSDIYVEGYGIVAGLNGQGSSEVPPQLREYLIKYIQQMLGNANRYEAMKFLNSNDNAAVHIYGRIPSGSPKGSKFDVVVEALSTTQTTSLNGGILYTSDLTASSRLGVAGAKKLALASGPVFLDWTGEEEVNPRKGRVIGGGTAFETFRMYLELENPDYMLAGLIRDRINERFGEKTANARSAEIISFTPPARYAGQHRKFAELVGAIYLPETNSSLMSRIEALTDALTLPENTISAEMGLEAIGRMALKSLKPLLDHDQEYVRLRAARCMLNIGYEKAIATLIDIASDRNSEKRLEAIKAIKNAMVSDEAVSPLRSLLNEEDADVRLAVYEILRDHGDISVSRQLTMAGFPINTVVTSGKPLVYIYRQDRQEIVLFGNHINVSTPLFIKDAANNVTINAAGEDKMLTLIRQHPSKPGIIGPFKSNTKLSDVIHRLTDNIGGMKKDRTGLGLNYSGTAAVIEGLWESGALEASLKLSPMNEITLRPTGGLPGQNIEEKK